MNKYEQRAAQQRAAQQRRQAMKSSATMWTAGVALVLVILLILGLSSSAPSNFYLRAAIGVAVLLLILRQMSRRSRGKMPKAAEPDPQSRLNLD